MTDNELKRLVTAELNWDPEVRSSAIGVAVKDGVVTLVGHLDTLAERDAAVRALLRVRGVKAAAVELDVKTAGPHRLNDSEIATVARDALRGTVHVAGQTIRLRVEQGLVTLEGEVEWDFQRRAAAAAIRPLRGVTGVRNEITLRTKPQLPQLARRIEEALTRQALREARQIHVAVEGNTVKLTGLVNSAPEREAVARIAWQAPGVGAVVNELVIA
jgi:osmotically-inducible protein OsmY